MNFYVGNMINEINMLDSNIEFSDELLDYIYKLSQKITYDMSKLYEINPYVDVEIEKNDLHTIIEICNYILDKKLLENYEEPDEGYEMLQNLIKISQKAIVNNFGLVSIGD